MKRRFNTSAYSLAKYYAVKVLEKEASTPISYSNTAISVHRIPVSALPPLCPHGRFTYSELMENKEGLRKFRESSVYYHQMQQETAVVEIRGPLGSGFVPVPEWIDLSVSLGSIKNKKVDFWHGVGSTGLEDVKMRYDDLIGENKELEKFLHVTCLDKESALQKRHWGFYKRRIADYVTGVSEGFMVPLKLVGVGYRAQVEDMNIEGPAKHDAEIFESWLRVNCHHVEKKILRKYMAENFPESIWAKIMQQGQLLQPEINLNFKEFEKRNELPLPGFPKKLVLKLGFTHNVELMIPPFIEVQIPNPARIVLKSPHKRQLQEFASQIRKWRPPEPYKGKGIFVGDESIVLKTKKVK